MSVRIIGSVLKHSQARLSARLVLVVLADSAHDDGVTWIAQKEIARKALISLAEVDRSLKEIAGIGEVETRKAQRGRRRINVYRVLVPGVEQPRYDDYPFALNEPFTTSQDETSSEIDDLSSGRSTTSHLVDISSPGTALKGSNRKGDPSGSNEPESTGPPPVVLVEGRNLGLDALMEVCEIGGAGGVIPRAPVAAVYLNGRKGEPGIRAIFWEEAREYAVRHAEVDRLERLTPEDFERALADAIRRKAERFRERMPNVTMGPKALRDWWLDLTRLAPAGGATGDDFRRMAS